MIKKYIFMNQRSKIHQILAIIIGNAKGKVWNSFAMNLLLFMLLLEIKSHAYAFIAYLKILL